MDLDAIITSPIFIIGFLFFALVIFPLIVFFTRPIMQMRLGKALREGGMPTTGRVTSLKHEVGKHTITKAPINFYSVSYEYEVGGQTYRNQQGVWAETYKTLREGGAVSIMYLPATPEKALLASTVQRSRL